jgi:TusA-related sulfurtransferase
MNFDKILDARGLACPMPIVKARQEINQIQVGQVLKVVSTDRGSVKDFQGWVQTAKNIQLLAQETEKEGDKEIYVHYVQRTS